jgi:hypothetical protein
MVTRELAGEHLGSAKGDVVLSAMLFCAALHECALSERKANTLALSGKYSRRLSLIGCQMRFFTKEWLRGELTDAAFEATPVAYRLHLATLQLPAAVSALAAVDMHDGLLLDVRHDPQSAELTLRLRCGDLQRGYRDLNITYSGTTLEESSLSVLREAMRDPKDEFLYDEVDRFGDRFEHRFILASHNEVRVTFANVAVGSHPVSSRTAK